MKVRKWWMDYPSTLVTEVVSCRDREKHWSRHLKGRSKLQLSEKQGICWIRYLDLVCSSNGRNRGWKVDLVHTQNLCTDLVPEIRCLAFVAPLVHMLPHFCLKPRWMWPALVLVNGQNGKRKRETQKGRYCHRQQPKGKEEKLKSWLLNLWWSKEVF